MSRYQRILVAVDGSETSDKALAEALALARDASGSLRILHVYDEAGHSSPREDTHFMRDTARGFATKMLEHDLQKVQTQSVQADTCLAEALGRGLGETVAAEAKLWGADLVVAGTHGRRGMRQVMLGSGA